MTGSGAAPARAGSEAVVHARNDVQRRYSFRRRRGAGAGAGAGALVHGPDRMLDAGAGAPALLPVGQRHGSGAWSRECAWTRCTGLVGFWWCLVFGGVWRRGQGLLVSAAPLDSSLL